MEGLLRFTGRHRRASAASSAGSPPWLVLLSCLISAGNAASRYLFSLSSNAWLEIQWQMFAGIFLLGAAYVLKLNEHVRVDLLYGGAPPRRKLWIDVIGLIFFLFPSMLVIGLLRLGVLPDELPQRRVSPRTPAASCSGRSSSCCPSGWRCCSCRGWPS